jgi:hypothetical protein
MKFVDEAYIDISAGDGAMAARRSGMKNTKNSAGRTVVTAAAAGMCMRWPMST